MAKKKKGTQKSAKDEGHNGSRGYIERKTGGRYGDSNPTNSGCGRSHDTKYKKGN